MAMCVMAVVAVAPCQCFSPGANQITSPGPMSSIGPPRRCTRPWPAVTIRVWPSGWLCHAVRAPGSNVTLAPTTRAGSGASNRGSMRTAPVKYSAGPLPEGCAPLLLMSIFPFSTEPASNRRGRSRLAHPDAPRDRSGFLIGDGAARQFERQLHLTVVVALVPEHVLEQEDRVVVVKVHAPARQHPALHRVPNRPGALVQHLGDATMAPLGHPLLLG